MAEVSQDQVEKALRTILERPKIYDVNIDEWRSVTQVDVDRLLSVQRAYGELRTFYEKLHAGLMEDVRKVPNG